MPVHQHNSVLLSRLMALKDYSPFILIQDSIAQGADYFLLELYHRVPSTANVIFLSFEATQTPERVNNLVTCAFKSPQQIHKEVQDLISTSVPNVVVIDTLTYIPTEQLTKFLVPMIQPKTTIVATIHTGQELKAKTDYYPSSYTLLSYFATATILVTPMSTDVHTQEDRENDIERLLIPVGCNRAKFEVQLAHRRRSGRSVVADYVMDYANHTIDYVPPEKKQEEENDEEAALEGLTTFNLQTTDKQKQQKENVDLPFYHAQEFGDGGAQGGAIIYEFEKDDDYDEEDPYEDPF